MLKLLLSHWQSHREPLPFVLTDDPLYCSHLTKSPFPEVYSVNRINPIFEDDEEKVPSNSSPPPSLKRKPGKVRTENEQFKTYPEDRKAVKLKNKDPFSSNFVLRKPISKPILNESEFSRNSHFRFYSPDSIFEAKSGRPLSLGRSLSDERREDDSKSSDDTGYSSSGQFKSSATLGSDGSVERHPMSSDSDDGSHPEAVIVSADVHRVSTPDDVLVRSASSESSANYSYRSYGSSPEPFDSLTMSSIDSSINEREIRRPNSVVKEKLQRLLEKGNPSSDDRKLIVNNGELEMQRTKNDLMKSLTRALNNKVPKRDAVEQQVVTRSDDTNTKPLTIDRKSNSSSTAPKKLATSSDSSGITRQDESNSSSLSSYTKPRKQGHQQRNSKHSSDKDLKSTEDSSDSQKTHKCKLCENAHRPLAFHQLLPGHWSYDNVYLPQMHGVMCSCMHPHHHGASVPPSDDEVFYPMFYHQNLSRVRHSWAPYTNGHSHKTEDKGVSTSSKENSSRYSPDGETDSSNASSSQLKKSLSERRSLREPKKCKCEHCSGMVMDKCPNPHNCTCYCLSHRRVKFASDSDISQHKHLHSFRLKDALLNGDKINAALVMNLPHLNGHVAGKGNSGENGKSKKPPSLIPRGLKEPIKVNMIFYN